MEEAVEFVDDSPYGLEVMLDEVEFVDFAVEDWLEVTVFIGTP